MQWMSDLLSCCTILVACVFSAEEHKKHGKQMNIVQRHVNESEPHVWRHVFPTFYAGKNNHSAGENAFFWLSFKLLLPSNDKLMFHAANFILAKYTSFIISVFSRESSLDLIILGAKDTRCLLPSWAPYFSQKQTWLLLSINVNEPFHM